MFSLFNIISTFIISIWLLKFTGISLHGTEFAYSPLMSSTNQPVSCGHAICIPTDKGSYHTDISLQGTEFGVSIKIPPLCPHATPTAIWMPTDTGS